MNRMMKRRQIPMGLLLLLTVMVLISGCGSKSDGLFEGLKWNTTYSEVEAAVLSSTGVQPEVQEDHALIRETRESYLGVEGVTARIEYAFDGEALKEVFVYLEFDENAYTNEEILARYEELLSTDYGKCSKGPSDSRIWKLGKSRVELANYYYGVAVLDYQPK